MSNAADIADVYSAEVSEPYGYKAAPRFSGYDAPDVTEARGVCLNDLSAGNGGFTHAVARVGPPAKCALGFERVRSTLQPSEEGFDFLAPLLGLYIRRFLCEQTFLSLGTVNHFGKNGHRVSLVSIRILAEQRQKYGNILGHIVANMGSHPLDDVPQKSDCSRHLAILFKFACRTLLIVLQCLEKQLSQILIALGLPRPFKPRHDLGRKRALAFRRCGIKAFLELRRHAEVYLWIVSSHAPVHKARCC